MPVPLLAPPPGNRPSTLRPWPFLALLVAALLWAEAALAFTVPRALVDAMWLYKNLDNVVVLEIRNDPETFSKRTRSDSGKAFNPCGIAKAVKDQPVFGHIPGARLIHWDEIMVEREMEGMRLKRMLPTASAFQQVMRKAGVNDDSAVVISSRGMTSFHAALATRLYWTLKYYGHDNVALLDGGTAEWLQKKRRVRFYAPTPSPGNFTIKAERKEMLASTAEVDKIVADRSAQIIDVRDSDYYEGLARVSEMVSQNGEGHIPEAVNFPTSKLIRSEGPAMFMKPYELHEIAEKNQIDTKAPAVLYCNIGLQGSLGWFALRELLLNPEARLYDGSMHAWSQNPQHQAVGF